MFKSCLNYEYYSGATTGTGGRLRDIEAIGRGGNYIAGTAGYSVGNLHIPGMCYIYIFQVTLICSLSKF